MSDRVVIDALNAAILTLTATRDEILQRHDSTIAAIGAIEAASDQNKLRSVLTEGEEREMLRDGIMHFLRIDPHHHYAQLLGQALADLG